MPQHHLVSQGYQRNFATPEKRLAVFSSLTGEIIDPARAIKSNWALPDFNSYITSDGELNSGLEGEWADVERSVLDQIRRISPDHCGPDQRSAVYNLMALHLVRSVSFEAAHNQIVKQQRLEYPRKIERDAELAAAFDRTYGRRPQPGEMAAWVRAHIDDTIKSRGGLIDSLARNHDHMAEKLAELHVQVVTTDSAGPGFVLADVPVVHADSRRERFGLRDGLGIGDADFIMAPLSRWTAIVLSATWLPHSRLRTKKQLQLINAAFIRAALAEVACHPDDLREARRVWGNLDRLPTRRLLFDMTGMRRK